MYRFSFVESVGGKAVEVDKTLFHDIIRRERIKSVCAKIAQTSDTNEISKLKRGLPAFCWHAWFDNGKRKNYCAHPSGLIMIDVDHIEKPRELFTSLLQKCGESSASGTDPNADESVEKRLGGYRLLAAHVTPSAKGLRLVFALPLLADGRPMDIESAQAKIVQALHLKNVDACTKDLARLSFCVPEEYFLYVDEVALFSPSQSSGQLPSGGAENSTAMPKETTGTNPTDPADPCLEGNTLRTPPARELANNRGQRPRTHTGESMCLEGTTQQDGRGLCTAIQAVDSASGDPAAPPVQPVTSPSGVLASSQDSGTGQGATSSGVLASSQVSDNTHHTYPEYYETTVSTPSHLGEGRGRGAIPYSICGGVGGGSVPYSVLVESLQELLGGVPAHGSRNNFIFSMAAYLRYVCDDDPDWIASILPTYGEAKEKWRRTIDSACQRAQYKVMPQIVKRAIANAKLKVERLELKVDDEGNDLPPAMPKKLPKLIAHLVKNVPEVCRPAVANAVFPALAAHLKGVKFWLIDGTEKEATFMCVTMAKQSSGKSAINKPIDCIVADIVERDELSRKREQEWKDAMASKGANKEKPKRPDDLCVQVLVSDMTNAAFVQRMKDANGKYLYTNLEELDLLKQLQTNGTKDVGKIICLCFDNGKYGQERVGTQSVTARVDLRWNWNASSTIQKGINFFSGRLVDGTLSRINFCTIIQDKSKPFRYGRYDEKYAETLKPYITNLNLANGHIECKQALQLAQQMQDECAEVGALSDDDVYQDLAFRAVTIAYLKAMVLYIANDMTWTKEIAEFARWSLNYDLWCKTHFFGEQVSEEKAKENVKKHRGRQNLLDLLPEAFTEKDAVEVRSIQGLEKDGTRQMLYLWKSRGYIEQDVASGRYLKTKKYLSQH